MCMYIKEIKLSGFKSFADKTTIELDKTFTGIVGPNGSGKSNIVDAIKWVLGEQSVKTLRGSNPNLILLLLHNIINLKLLLKAPSIIERASCFISQSVLITG